MNFYRLALTLGVALAAAGARAQTTTYDWSLTGSSIADGSGTITLDSTAGAFQGAYPYSVVAMTGSLNGSAIVSLFAPISGGGIALSFTTPTLPPTSPQSDYVGILLGATLANSDSITLEDPNPVKVTDGNTSASDQTGTFAVSPVPEPGTLALVTMGGLGLAAWRRRK